MDLTQGTLLAVVVLVLILFVKNQLRNRSITQYSPADLSSRLGNNSGLLLLDVRTRGEHEAQHIKGSVHVPLNELRIRVGELERYRQKQIVCYCQSGQRSLNAAAFLRKTGFSVANLKGGIGAWNFYKLKGS
jgi:rhodanese-related sulfurtransferase